MERLFARQRVINPSRFDAKRENHLLQADCSRQRMFGPYANRSRGAQALSRSRIGQETRPGRPRARTHCSVEDKAGPEGLLSGEIPGILIYAIYVLRAHRSLSRRLLCCFPLVVLQHAPQAFATPHSSHLLCPGGWPTRWTSWKRNNPNIILNREKSITLGTLGTLALWRSTKLSPGMGELCADAAPMRTQEFGSWRSRNGCLIRWPAAVCAWRRCPRSAAVHCWI